MSTTGVGVWEHNKTMRKQRSMLLLAALEGARKEAAEMEDGEMEKKVQMEKKEKKEKTTHESSARERGNGTQSRRRHTRRPAPERRAFKRESQTNTVRRVAADPPHTPRRYPPPLYSYPFLPTFLVDSHPA